MTFERLLKLPEISQEYHLQFRQGHTQFGQGPSVVWIKISPLLTNSGIWLTMEPGLAVAK